MDFDIPTRWMSMVVCEPARRLTYNGDIINNPICRYKGQEVELVYNPCTGDCSIKEGLLNVNPGDQIKVKGVMKIEPVNVKSMLSIRLSLTVEDIDEDDYVSEQEEEPFSDYGYVRDDETGTEDDHQHSMLNTDKHTISHSPDRPSHDEPYYNTPNTNNFNIARATHNDLYHNMPNRSTHDVPYHNIFETKKFNSIRLNRSIHHDPCRSFFSAKNLNADNTNITRVGHDDLHRSASNGQKRSIEYHPYKSVLIDPSHEMGLGHRRRPIKRRCTPYPKTSPKQHHRDLSTPCFGSNSVIGHQEAVPYRHGTPSGGPIKDDAEEDRHHPFRYNPVTRTAWSSSVTPNKKDSQNEVLDDNTPVTRMFHSPSITSIKKEEDDDQYVFDYSNTYTRRESDKDVYYYSSLGTAMAEQQAGGPNPEVDGSSSCQFDPPFRNNLILPMMPMPHGANALAAHDDLAAHVTYAVHSSEVAYAGHVAPAIHVVDVVHADLSAQVTDQPSHLAPPFYSPMQRW
ncbi:hypothetical protein BGZ90_011703 [Linnemannia elongata]|nr:hypothetical protein BGZ90_011703 [Linnemannia elongata]